MCVLASTADEIMHYMRAAGGELTLIGALISKSLGDFFFSYHHRRLFLSLYCHIYDESALSHRQDAVSPRANEDIVSLPLYLVAAHLSEKKTKPNKRRRKKSLPFLYTEWN